MINRAEQEWPDEQAHDAKTYVFRGVVILPADRNSSGIRWTASLHDGVPLRADTLHGIKQLIRERLSKTKR